jgi:histone-lysine N-methyltransferase SETD2
MGASSTHQSLSLGYCFMQNESKENYVWALKQLKDCYGPQILSFKAVVTDRELALMNAINEVFPDAKNLLCKWHIENNILSNIKTYFSTPDWEKFEVQWNELSNSITPDIFDQNLAKLKTNIPTKAYDYIFKTWIGHKEKFVLAWTKDVLHFGHTVTSRIEGGHANVKGWIPNTNGDLETVYGKLLLACQQQRNRIFHKIDFDRTHILTQLRPKFWDRVNRRISQHALLEVIIVSSHLFQSIKLSSHDSPSSEHSTGLQTVSKITLVGRLIILPVLICIFHLNGTPLCSFSKAAC